MRMILLFLLLCFPLLLLGCATGEPTALPWFAAETLSKKEVEGFEKIMSAIKQRGCIKTRGNLAVYGQSGEWEHIGCYGMDPGAETPYVELLK